MGTVPIYRRHVSFTTPACAALLLALAGCWEEIQYVGPDPAASKSAAKETSENQEAPAAGDAGETSATAVADTSDVAAEASDFGDELTANLASESGLATDAEASPSPPELDSPDSDSLEQPQATSLLPHELPDPIESDPGTTTDELLGRASPEQAVDSQMNAESIESLPSDTVDSTLLPPDAADSGEAEPPEPKYTRLYAWQLGSKLSLAALANDRGVAADKVERWLADSRKVAVTMKATFSDLPPTGAAGQSGNPSREVLEYLFQQSAQLSRHLATNYGTDHAALYEIAVKSNLLLVMYQPGSSTTGAIAAAIRDAAPRAKLPDAAVKPLLELVSNGADPVEVRKHVQRLHAQVERYLGQRVER